MGEHAQREMIVPDRQLASRSMDRCLIEISMSHPTYVRGAEYCVPASLGGCQVDGSVERARGSSKLYFGDILSKKITIFINENIPRSSRASTIAVYVYFKSPTAAYLGAGPSQDAQLFTSGLPVVFQAHLHYEPQNTVF